LEFDKYGTYPVYLAKPTHLIDFFTFLATAMPTYACFHLLFTNPYPFSEEPLCLPAFLFLGVIGIWKCFKRLADNSLTIYEVRLKSDGMHAEVMLYNFLGFHANSKKFTMVISELSPPPLHPDSIPLKGDLFPHLTQGLEIPQRIQFSKWVKYSANIRRKYFIPKRYSYMNQELMIAIMNGCYIKYNLTL